MIHVCAVTRIMFRLIRHSAIKIKESKEIGAQARQRLKNVNLAVYLKQDIRPVFTKAPKSTPWVPVASSLICCVDCIIFAANSGPLIKNPVEKKRYKRESRHRAE